MLHMSSFWVLDHVDKHILYWNIPKDNVMYLLLYVILVQAIYFIHLKLSFESEY